jgi:hypothetical protein
MARVPEISIRWAPALVFAVALLLLLLLCAGRLWRTTRFH